MSGGGRRVGSSSYHRYYLQVGGGRYQHQFERFAICKVLLMVVRKKLIWRQMTYSKLYRDTLAEHLETFRGAW